MSPVHSSSRGVSLIEAVITTAVLALLGGALFGLFHQSQGSFRSQLDLVETTQQLRVALDQIVRYLRQAGSDPYSALAVPPIQWLADGELMIYSDITGTVASATPNAKESTGDPDGTLNSIYEQVRIRHDAAGRRLWIDIGYGEEVLAERVTEFEVEFFDLSGLPAPDPTAASRLRLTLVGQGRDKDLHTGLPRTVRMTSDVFLRARSFQVFQP